MDNTSPQNIPIARVISAVLLIAMAVASWHFWIVPTLSTTEAAPVPTQPQALDGLYLRGSRSAQVALIVFADFECPACRTFANQVLPQLETKYVDKGTLLLAYGQLPLSSIHPRAFDRAVLAECASRQDKFWQVHDILYSRQNEQSVEDAGRAILDPKALAACSMSHPDSAIEASLSRTRALGLSSTPTIFVGRLEASGVRVRTSFVGGQTLGTVSAAIERELGVRSQIP